MDAALRLTIPIEYFLEIRDPATMKLVCRYNPQTNEVVTIGRSGDVRRGILPIVCSPPETSPVDKETEHKVD